MLREGDGGRNVHYLQIALERQGFISHTDDQRWWFFGSSTHDCVLMAQVSHPPGSKFVQMCGNMVSPVGSQKGEGGGRFFGICSVKLFAC